MTLTPADELVLAATGMSACFGAVVRAPFTSILMIFEMTHQQLLEAHAGKSGNFGNAGGDTGDRAHLTRLQV